MRNALYTALAWILLNGGAVQAAGITADPGTECWWQPAQRVQAVDCPPLAASSPEPAAPPRPERTLFPEMNIRELCATVGPAAAPYCEARNFAAREQLVELWQTATEHTRHMCTTQRPAPPHARYVVIVSCVQAQANVAWEQRMKANGY